MKWGLTNECFEDEKREETYRKVCYFVKIKPEILAFALKNILHFGILANKRLKTTRFKSFLCHVSLHRHTNLDHPILTGIK